MNLLRLIGAAASATAVMFASPAANAISASANLDWSGFQISVVDTDSQDGISAGY